jgi:hypothetical protein
MKAFANKWRIAPLGSVRVLSDGPVGFTRAVMFRREDGTGWLWFTRNGKSGFADKMKYARSAIKSALNADRPGESR